MCLQHAPWARHFCVLAQPWTKTTSLTLMFGFSSVHAVRFWWVMRYSRLHCSQKLSARNCTCFLWCKWSSGVSTFPDGAVKVLVFCIKCIAGVKMVGLSGSVDTGMSGLAFITPITSAIKVLSTSWVSCDRLQHTPWPWAGPSGNYSCR